MEQESMHGANSPHLEQRDLGTILQRQPLHLCHMTLLLCLELVLECFDTLRQLLVAGVELHKETGTDVRVGQYICVQPASKLWAIYHAWLL